MVEQTTVAIPFISFDSKNSGFHVTDEAKDFLKNLPAK